MSRSAVAPSTLGRMLRVAQLSWWAGDYITPAAIETVLLGAKGVLGGRVGDAELVLRATGWCAYIQGAYVAPALLAVPRVCA